MGVLLKGGGTQCKKTYGDRGEFMHVPLPSAFPSRHGVYSPRDPVKRLFDISE